MHMMQLWVNLPRKDKTAAPAYQPITAAQIPRVELPDGAGAVRVIAGAYGDARGPAHTFTPISMLDVSLAAGGRLPVELPRSYNAMAVVVAGARAGRRRDRRTRASCCCSRNDGERLELTADEDEPRPHPGGRADRRAGRPVRPVRDEHASTRSARPITDVNAGRFGPIPD